MDINEDKGKDCISIDLSYPSCCDNGTGLKPSLIHRFTQSALAGRMISENVAKIAAQSAVWMALRVIFTEAEASVLMMHIVIIQSDDAINSSFLQ